MAPSNAASVASLGKRLQWLIAPAVRSTCLIASLNLSGFGFQPLGHDMLLSAKTKSSLASDILSPCRHLSAVIKLPLNLT